MMELRTDINGLKESIIGIKEMLRNLKKGDKISDEGEILVNGEERKEERGSKVTKRTWRRKENGDHGPGE